MVTGYYMTIPELDYDSMNYLIKNIDALLIIAAFSYSLSFYFYTYINCNPQILWNILHCSKNKYGTFLIDDVFS